MAHTGEGSQQCGGRNGNLGQKDALAKTQSKEKPSVWLQHVECGQQKWNIKAKDTFGVFFWTSSKPEWQARGTVQKALNSGFIIS